jgi:hypothetical protein
MTAKPFVLLIIIAVSLAACASSPEHIAAAKVSEDPYLTWACERVGEESYRLRDALTAASAKQQRAADNDAVGVFLIGLPVASMSGGDVSPEVSRLKGESAAVRKAAITNGCDEAKLAPIPPEPPPPFPTGPSSQPDNMRNAGNA